MRMAAAEHTERNVPATAAAAAVAAVLAGGAGRRLGGAKATSLLAGAPLISYPLAAAGRAGLDVLVVAKAGSALPDDLACPILREPDLPRHPLCGIIAALTHVGGPVLALGCDMPFLPSALLGWMAHLDGPAIAAPGGRPQPLLALWTPKQLPALRDALRREAAMGELVAELGLRQIGDDRLSRFGEPQVICLNVNDPADLDRAEQIARVRGLG